MSGDEMTVRRRGAPLALLCGFALCLVVTGIVWWLRCGSATTLLIVRHADRPATEDALSTAGLARARELLRVVRKAGVRAIYHSDTNRARQTAQPLATTLGITPVEIPGKDIDRLVGHIFANHRGATVLVVGHSNTVPRIITAAGGPALGDLAEDEFDNLFVLEVCPCRRGVARLLNLEYGSSSPEPAL